MTPDSRKFTLSKFLRSVLFFLFLFAGKTMAQSKLIKDSSYILRIPNIITMVSSPAHFYVLSSTDGLVVFRAHQDTLAWLYTSPGMQQRGDKMSADIRFAYLYGKNSQLTVIEPTSLLGVYSSTNLPAPALSVHRLNNSLYIALGNLGIGKISLTTPDAVDSTISFIKPGSGSSQPPSIIDLQGTPDRLLALGNNNAIYEYSANGDTVTFRKKVTVSPDITHIYLLKDELLGSTAQGKIYSIDNSGNTSLDFNLNAPVNQIAFWKGYYLIRDKKGQLWVAKKGQQPYEFRKETDSGNLFTINKDNLWVSQFNQISRILDQSQNSNMADSSTAPATKLTIEPISNQIVPYPHPLLLALNTTGNYPAGQIKFHYLSKIKTAIIKGNGFYWQPSSNDIGIHKFTVFATSDNGQVDSTSFTVSVRSFNQPPRFSPVQNMSIPVNQKFTLKFNAIDPDGTNRHLVRFVGVNLPDGAVINEKNGEFTWTPNLQQIGKNTFRVIATDQYGASSSMPVSITVLDVTQ